MDNCSVRFCVLLSYCFLPFFFFFWTAISLISSYGEITIEGNVELRIGEKIKMRDGTKIRVRKGGVSHLGDNFSMNSHDMVVCHGKLK